MQTLLTPFNIGFLLHCHISPYAHPQVESPAARAAEKLLLEYGAIEESGQANKYSGAEEMYPIYKTTPMGKAWVIALTQLPAPKPVYVDANGKILD
jgi:hypothetical protein